MARERFYSPIEFFRKGIGSKKPFRIFVYIIAGAMTFPICERVLQDYERDLVQYSEGVISREPKLIDYSPIGCLERSIENDKID